MEQNKDEILEEDEKIEYFQEKILDRTSFFIDIQLGSVIPIINPNYYNKIEISLNYNYKEPYNKVLIYNKEYSINEEQFNKIHEIVENSFDKLIKIARNQKLNFIVGAYNTIRIKLGAIFLDISEHSISSEEEKKFFIEFENQIVNILSIESNAIVRYVYKEGSNNPWIKETI